MPPSASDGQDRAGDRLEAAQRSNARKLGTLLVVVIAAIVAAAFAFVISNKS